MFAASPFGTDDLWRQVGPWRKEKGWITSLLRHSAKWLNWARHFRGVGPSVARCPSPEKRQLPSSVLLPAERIFAEGSMRRKG